MRIKWMRVLINEIIQADATKYLLESEKEQFDLVVFSPPYDQLRDYNGYSIDLHKLGKGLFHVLKPGGIVAMVIQDQTISGHKTLTSFRTIVDWCDSFGFGLWECAIYHKNGKDGAWWSKRFRVDHEYMPIFVKGKAPKYFDKQALQIPCKHAGKTMRGGANRNKNGKTIDSVPITINKTKCIGTVWDCRNGGDKVALKRTHPATFPDKIPFNFIKAFTEEGDHVLDPMVGSGSTAVAASLLHRNFVGIDISEEYCELARLRVATKQSNLEPGFRNKLNLTHTGERLLQ